jgi:hypothetical protein
MPSSTLASVCFGQLPWEVEQGWKATSEMLVYKGEPQLAGVSSTACQRHDGARANRGRAPIPDA